MILFAQKEQWRAWVLSQGILYDLWWSGDSSLVLVCPWVGCLGILPWLGLYIVL